MKAARLHNYGERLVVGDVPTPRPGPGHVLVRVGAGFCHSDIHVIDGEIQVVPRMPLTLGHENAGTVTDVGSGVNAVHEGDPVAVYGGRGCGICNYCVTGHEQLCEIRNGLACPCTTVATRNICWCHNLTGARAGVR